MGVDTTISNSRATTVLRSKAATISKDIRRKAGIRMIAVRGPVA